jgi:hypothetical protein
MSDAEKLKRKAKPQPRNYWFVDFAALLALVFVIGVILMMVVTSLLITSGIIQTQPSEFDRLSTQIAATNIPAICIINHNPPPPCLPYSPPTSTPSP